MKKRVQSFKIENWFGMPEILSPIEMSLKGFQCTSYFTVKCQFCGAEQDMSSMQFNKDESAIERAIIQLKECHFPQCAVESQQLSDWKIEGVWDRRQAYLYANEIFHFLYQSSAKSEE